jgi:hypothetical protein
MARTGKQHAGTLIYPKHRLNPQDLLNFTEMSGFVDDWEGLKLDVEFDLLALQVQIMAFPRQGALIPGTGGLRKMDFAPPAQPGRKRRGKRNSCRICYVYFEEFHTVLLVFAYAKNQKDDLTSAEKTIHKRAIERIHARLSARYYT